MLGMSGPGRTLLPQATVLAVAMAMGSGVTQGIEPAQQAIKQAERARAEATEARRAVGEAKQAVEQAAARLKEAKENLETNPEQDAAKKKVQTATKELEQAKSALGEAEKQSEAKQQKAIEQWEAAVKKATAAAEAYRNTEHFARQQANDASREIARSERRRAEVAVEELLAARQKLKEKIAAAEAARKAAGDTAEQDQVVKQAERQVAAARQEVDKKLATMRAAGGRLIDDSLTSDEAAWTEDAASKILETKAVAARAAEVALLELKAQQSADDQAETLRRKAWQTRALKALESQGWASWRRLTMEQLQDRTTDAARIARRLVDAEVDEGQKQKLETFIKTETETACKAEEHVAKENAIIDGLAHEVYRWRAQALGGLEPLSPDAWDRGKARHLLMRAGFGGTPAQVEQLTEMGLYKAVDHFVQYYRQPAAGSAFSARPLLPKDPLVSQVRMVQRNVQRASINASQMEQLRRWWLKQMVQSPRPLEEKLALFWHGHFATQNSTVNNSYTMYKQNQLFREQAAGNFGALLHGIIHDPAMIRYLDNNANVKEHPNENLAREIMELFSMGPYEGYDEADVREAARALTGYSFDHHTGQFRYEGAKHDPEQKTIFGKTGHWTGEDLVQLILEQPATSRFVTRKLFEFFAYQDPNDETIEKLSAVLRQRDYELEPMLKNLFLSKQFYSDRATGARIKSPVQLVVGSLRDLGVEQVTDAAMLDSAVQEMGQQLFQPPDVKGWRRGRAWVSAKRMFARYNAVGELIKSIPHSGGSGIDVVRFVQQGGVASPEEIVDYLARACLAKPLNEESRAKLIELLEGLPPESSWTQQRDQLNQKLRTVLILITSLPEYQMS